MMSLTGKRGSISIADHLEAVVSAGGGPRTQSGRQKTAETYESECAGGSKAAPMKDGITPPQGMAGDTSVQGHSVHFWAVALQQWDLSQASSFPPSKNRMLGGSRPHGLFLASGGGTTGGHRGDTMPHQLWSCSSAAASREAALDQLDRLAAAVLRMPRRPFGRGALLSERDWLRSCQRAWAMLRSPSSEVQDYVKWASEASSVAP